MFCNTSIPWISVIIYQWNRQYLPHLICWRIWRRRKGWYDCIPSVQWWLMISDSSTSSVQLNEQRVRNALWKSAVRRFKEADDCKGEIIIHYNSQAQMKFHFYTIPQASLFGIKCQGYNSHFTADLWVFRSESLSSALSLAPWLHENYIFLELLKMNAWENSVRSKAGFLKWGSHEDSILADNILSDYISTRGDKGWRVYSKIAQPTLRERIRLTSASHVRPRRLFARQFRHANNISVRG